MVWGFCVTVAEGCPALWMVVDGVDGIEEGGRDSEVEVEVGVLDGGVGGEVVVEGAPPVAAFWGTEDVVVEGVEDVVVVDELVEVTAATLPGGAPANITSPP